MKDSPARPSFSAYHCRDCGSDIGFRSRRRNLVERIILPVLFLQPVRCGECFRRDYRFIFTPVRQRLSDGPSRIMPRKSSDTSDRNVA